MFQIDFLVYFITTSLLHRKKLNHKVTLSQFEFNTNIQILRYNKTKPKGIIPNDIQGGVVKLSRKFFLTKNNTKTGERCIC